MKLTRLWVLLTLVLLVHTVYAQSTLTIPLVFQSNNDLYIYSENRAETEQLTDCQCVLEYLASFDSRYVAYIGAWDVAQNYFAALGYGISIYMPANVWVIDLTTDEIFIIAEQPVDASYTQNDETDHAFGRMDLNFSPETHELAWVEYIFPAHPTSEVVIYNLDTQTRRVVSRSDEFVAQGDANPLSWRADGLIYMSYIRETQTQIANIVAPDGSEIYRGVTDEIFPPSWIEIGSKNYLIWSWTETNDHFTALDPTTGEFQDFEGHVMTCSALVEQSLCTYRERASDHIHFYLVMPDGSIEELPQFVWLSADGQAYFYRDASSGQGYIWRDGVTISLPSEFNIQDIRWGSLELRLLTP